MEKNYILNTELIYTIVTTHQLNGNMYYQQYIYKYPCDRCFLLLLVSIRFTAIGQINA